MDPAERDRLTSLYSQMGEVRLREALRYGPEGYASSEVWELLVEVAGRRGVSVPTDDERSPQTGTELTEPEEDSISAGWRLYFLAWGWFLFFVTMFLLSMIFPLFWEGDFADDGWAWLELRNYGIGLLLVALVVWVLSRQYRRVKMRQQRAADDGRTEPGRVRVVVLAYLGPPFGGFRIAMRPGTFGLDNPGAFVALEEAIQTAFNLYSRQPPDRWPELAAKDMGRAATPRWQGRDGIIDIVGNVDTDPTGSFMMRAFLPFPVWRMGGWAVYAGWHRNADGTWTPMAEEELEGIW